MNHTAQYLREAALIIDAMDQASIERTVDILADLRERDGRLFVLGVGGGAANASHMVNDFRKIARIESYTPVDNVSELTARINDDGWQTSFSNWLVGSHLSSTDVVLVLSVGGGDEQNNVSINIINALQYAKTVGSKICGIVGRDGGFTRTVADALILVPSVNVATITPHTESFQAMMWHLMVTHPKLKIEDPKWESIG